MSHSLRRLGTASSVFLALLATPLLAHAAEGTDFFSTSLKAHGWWAALPAAFLVGLATAITPCVYPMIAITVSVFGARNETRGRAMALSTAFVAGIAAMFVPLGLAAGMSGSVAGALAGKLGVQIFEAALMFAMAASMFGLFEISLPASVQNRLAAIGGLGIKGAFLIGLATGPIAAPCATAGLVGILDYVFRTKNAIGGGTALLVYSMGLGLPFWLVGTFSVGLPKPGKWMSHVKSVFGLVLVVVGFWYLRKALPFLAEPPRAIPGVMIVTAAMIVAGLVLGAIHLDLKDGSWGQRVRKIAGIGLASLGAVWMLGHEPSTSTTGGAAGACNEIAWQRDPAAAQALARREGRPMVIDFGATWCPACEELAHITFRAPQVACAASEGHFVSVKIYEDDNPPANYDQLRAQYNVRALPTVVVIDANGREIARETQFVPAERMAAMLRRADERRSER